MKQLTLILLLATATLVGQNTFTLTSSDLGGQATKNQEFGGFGCTGKNESPQLSWKNAPAETKSFAITMYDPDAPTGSGWWHWLVFDIPTNISSIPTNAGNVSLNLLPKEVVQSITDYGTRGYGGPCPPQGHGFHQYIITVYALNKETLKLNSKTNPAVVGYYLNSSALAKASIVAYYKRDK
ncbi:YbhB/YbcL family Raf kinase inhibitor-like protein [Tenacibaculum xiamenense]|uniref:YbhB/YbcL family Raf kinase inhibitor-like protein n=1 Tax=Tenacibaculum xiamenense TaxID=1261553 RepID=UPI003893B6CF